MTSSGVIFEDIFDIKDMDPDGKKFDRVSRLHCESESFKMDLILDVNTQIYPMELGEKFRMVIASTLGDDAADDVGEYQDISRFPKADQYEYIMYGKVYRLEGDDAASETGRLAAYVSYGGLLMRLQGDAANLINFEQDNNVYLLMKKLAFWAVADWSISRLIDWFDWLIDWSILFLVRCADGTHISTLTVVKKTDFA